jgi:hypothetical protein
MSHPGQNKAAEEGHGMGADSIEACGLISLPQRCEGLGKVRPLHHLRETLDHLHLPPLKFEAQLD